jgi:AcrR family transcriptional regulator
MTSRAHLGRQRAGRLPRGSLTPEQIVSESLRLLDEHGVNGFSLPKLGRALGADPTALYRHFSSKDDLLLAIADRLIEESMDGLQASECWVDTLVDIAVRLRRAYRAHPAAASFACFRTTRRPAEMHAVDVIIGAVLRAGFKGAEAAAVYRAYGDFVLAFAGGEAQLLALDPVTQEADRMAWAGAYLTVKRADYPHTWQIRTALPKIDENRIFETILALVIDGIMRRAPSPCGCEHHLGRALPAV